MNLHLSILTRFVSTKINIIRNDFDFDIVNFRFLDGEVARRPAYRVYIPQFINFARVCSHVYDINTRNECLTSQTGLSVS